MVRIKASSCRRARMLSSTEMKMLAKLRAMISMAMARSADAQSKLLRHAVHFDGRKGHLHVGVAQRVGDGQDGEGLRFFRSMAVISRFSGSRTSPSSMWTYQMLSMGVNKS